MPINLKTHIQMQSKIMKKNRLQRLQEDMNEDLQKYLDEDLLDTTPKGKKESTFWMKCVALCLLCSYGIAQFLGRVLGDKQAIVQYGLAGVIVICALAFYIWLRRKYR